MATVGVNMIMFVTGSKGQHHKAIKCEMSVFCRALETVSFQFLSV